GPIPGEKVFAIGNPAASGGRWAYRSGEVVRNTRELHQMRDAAHPKAKLRKVECQVIAMTLQSEPGMSGSPVFNVQGKLGGVGFGVQQLKAKSGYAIEIRELKALLKEHNILQEIAAGSSAPANAGAHTAEPPAGPAPSGHAKSATRQETVNDQPAKTPPANPRPAPVPETPEQIAARKLKLAVMMADGGVKDKARARFQEIVTNFPDTEAAKTARQWLDKLSK